LWLGLALPAFQRRVYVLDDLANYHLPLRFFYSRCLKSGDDCSWCPQVFCGFDLHGEGQVGMLHPLHWILYRLLPIDAAFNAELLIGFPVLWTGAWVFFGRWNLGIGAQAWGALAMTFAGLPMVRAVHINALQIIVHLPWLLVAVDAVVRPRMRARRGWALIGIALLIGSQLLLGYPQFAWITWLVAAAYATAFSTSASWAALPTLASAALVGVLLGAVQLLPTYGALKDSVRAAPSREFRAERSLPPANLLQPIAPYFFAGRVLSDDATNPALSVEYACYFGGATPALVLWALSRRRRMGTAWPLARFGLWLAAMGVILALGKYTPFFDFVAGLPGLNTFRAPCRYLLLTHIGFALASTAAFADLSCGPGWRSGAVGWALLVATIVGVCLWGCWRQAATGDSTLGPTDDVIAGATLVAASTLLVAATAAGVRGALTVFVIFFAVDIGCYGVRYLRETEPQAPSDQPPRTFPHRLWMTPHGLGPIVQGWSLANGYVGLPPKRALDYTAPKVRRAAGVGIELRDDLQFAPLTPPLPRFRFVSKAKVQSGAIDALLATIDPAEAALVDEGAGFEDGASFSGGCEFAARVDRPGRIELDVRVENRRLLVIAESWHRGWSAVCDGRPRPLVRVYGDFMGVVVEPGDRRVELRYSPPSLALGCWFAAAGVVGLAGLLLLGDRFTRPRGDLVAARGE
jgi:hypothetical protein